MIGAIVIADGGAGLKQVDDALRRVSGLKVLLRLTWRRPSGPAIQALQPDLIFIDEPARTPLPLAVIREARSSAPASAVVVRASDATADWLADALQAGATAVLPGVVEPETLRRVVEEALEMRVNKREAVRLRWAA